MPSPKDGTACSIVPAAEAVEAKDADSADPGEVEAIKAQQRETHTGKYGSQPVEPYKPPETDEEKAEKYSWIEVKLHDKNGKPVPGELCRITLPDNTVWQGTLDGKGFVRVDGIKPGSCKITFPRRHKTLWSPG